MNENDSNVISSIDNSIITSPVPLSEPGISQDTVNVTSGISINQPISQPVHVSGSSYDNVTVSSNNQPAQETSNLNSQAGLLQSTIGMVSSMQGTIASLQSTINNLLQNQSLGVSTNHLEQFYKGIDQRSINSVQTSASYQLHGVAADSLPHIDVVSESVRKNITSGKYVNLACPLIQD